jgi:hypothetical protein
MRHFWLCALASVMIGCGGESGGELVPLEKVPPAMVQTAKEKLPDVTFENAVKRSDGSYEVRGKDKQGKVRDVEFSASGEVTEVE